MIKTAVGVDHILKSEPILKPKVWGGRRLWTVLGKHLPADQKIGESWEVADIPEGTSRIGNGVHAGQTLHEVVQEHSEDFTSGCKSFPLLVKFIDVTRDTSIQVHPDAETCRRSFPLARPKTETWIVIDAEPDASVYHGLRPGCSHDEFSRRAHDGTVEQCLRRVPVSVGDVIHVPAGTVHALLAGVLVLEIQEPSDTTFRLEDRGRTGEEARELQIEQAIESVRPEEVPAKITADSDEFQWGECQTLVDTDAYAVHRMFLRGKLCWSMAREWPLVATIVSGQAVIRCQQWMGTGRMGDTFIIPPRLGEANVEPDDDCTVVIAEPQSCSSQRP